MRNKGKYKVPKAHAFWPILWRTVVFLTVIVLIFAVLHILAEYVRDFRSEADKEYVRTIATVVDTGTPEVRQSKLNVLERDNHAYCVIDLEGNIVESSGAITVSGYNSKTGEFAAANLHDILDESDVKEEDVDNVKQHVMRAAANSTFLLDDSETTTDALRDAYTLARNNPNFLNGSDDAVLSFPYWIAAPMNESQQILLVKSELTVKVKDYTYLAAGLGIALIISFFVFILMIVSVIMNLSANRKLRKWLFRDNIAKGHNWLWYAVNAQDILHKRRNAHKTYAVVDLVFVRYRNFVLCHSVKEAESLLSLVVVEICKKLKKGELIAHSTAAALPLLLEVKDEDDAKARLQDIISTLEAIPCGHRLAFKAGVYLVIPAQEKVALNQKRYIPDVDLLYNNACAASLSLAEVADSGIAFFDSNLVDEEKWIDTVTNRQQAAVNNEEFLVYYQPKYDPRTNEHMGTEALIRWQTPDMGLVPPYKFIPIFEDNGFITQIDDYMLTHVARNQRKWLSEGRKCVPISCNVSRAHFGTENLAEYICNLVDREGCPRSLIEIELTESAFFDDENAMITTINRLKSYGFLVSMDDFGTGYSSLNSLKDMPLDILKLDAGFFRGSEDNPRTRIVVSEALALARSLNMKTVAEGVEDKSTVDFLAQEGCDMIQGYYYARPMPREEYEKNVIPVPQPVAPVAPTVEQPVAPAPVAAPPVEPAPVATPVQETVPVQQEAPVQPAASAPVEAPVVESAPTSETTPIDNGGNNG